MPKDDAPSFWQRVQAQARAEAEAKRARREAEAQSKPAGSVPPTSDSKAPPQAAKGDNLPGIRAAAAAAAAAPPSRPEPSPAAAAAAAAPPSRPEPSPAAAAPPSRPEPSPAAAAAAAPPSRPEPAAAADDDASEAKVAGKRGAETAAGEPARGPDPAAAAARRQTDVAYCRQVAAMANGKNNLRSIGVTLIGNLQSDAKYASFFNGGSFEASIDENGVFHVTSGSPPAKHREITGRINGSTRTFNVERVTNDTFTVTPVYQLGPQRGPISFTLTPILTRQAMFPCHSDKTRDWAADDKAAADCAFRIIQQITNMSKLDINDPKQARQMKEEKNSIPRC